MIVISSGLAGRKIARWEWKEGTNKQEGGIRSGEGAGNEKVNVQFFGIPQTLRKKPF